MAEDRLNRCRKKTAAEKAAGARDREREEEAVVGGGRGSKVVVVEPEEGVWEEVVMAEDRLNRCRKKTAAETEEDMIYTVLKVEALLGWGSGSRVVVVVEPEVMVPEAVGLVVVEVMVPEAVGLVVVEVMVPEAVELVEESEGKVEVWE
jgi:hypothetical protein